MVDSLRQARQAGDEQQIAVVDSGTCHGMAGGRPDECAGWIPDHGLYEIKVPGPIALCRTGEAAGDRFRREREYQRLVERQWFWLRGLHIHFPFEHMFDSKSYARAEATRNAAQIQGMGLEAGRPPTSGQPGRKKAPVRLMRAGAFSFSHERRCEPCSAALALGASSRGRLGHPIRH
jgi:hypothetical protein